MHQTKKGNQWYFGMKVHVGADVHSGPVHTVSVTPANASDISQLPHLLREEDRAVFGDKGYVNNNTESLREECHELYIIQIIAVSEAAPSVYRTGFCHAEELV